MDLHALLAPVEGVPHVVDALVSWDWLVPPNVEPLLATAFGDLFVIGTSGVVYFLDIVEGSFDPVAESVSAWEQLLRDTEFVDRHFFPAFVVQLRESGATLAQGECYVPQLEPILGGGWNTANWSPGRWVWHLERQGRVHFAIKDLPDGREITVWNHIEVKDYPLMRSSVRCSVTCRELFASRSCRR